MTKSFLKNTFSVFFDKEIFTAVIAGLAIIGFISWAHVRKSTESEVEHRLEYAVENISSVLTESLNNYALSTAYTRAYFDTHGVPSKKTFRKFVENLQARSTTNNMIDLDYIPKHELIAKARHLPATHRMDVLINSSATLLTMTYALKNISPESLSMALILPYYAKATPEKVEQRKSDLRGVIYLPFNVKDLFENLLGIPNPQKENVNFQLSYIDELTGNETIAYSRFDSADDLSLTKAREIQLFGKKWRINVTARDGFLSFSDLYLGHVVALATALVIGLLLSLFKQFENTIAHEAKQKALIDESNRMKTAFLANMSHEIRTPLNAITGYSEILARTESPTDRRTLIENIQKNSSQLTSIIDNILDISNIEFGKLFISTHRLTVRSLFEEVILSMRNRADAKGIDFNFSVSGLLPEYIHTAESRVKQILINLLGNAIKFTESGQVSLGLKAEKDSLGAWYLFVTVADTGIGISKQDQADLFQSFSQVDASSTRRFGGIGLGLVVSKRMAKQFGGDVYLKESHLGQGSTFELKIPCGDISNCEWVDNLFTDLFQAKSVVNIQNYSALNGKRVLIVEDSIDNQDIFQFFLQSVGAVTEVVDNGISAVRNARTNDYDLILMDIQLPQMDGLEATRRIRIEGFTRPIIALTAHASPEERASSFEAGCNGLITKPVSQDTLAQQIITIVSDSTVDMKSRKVALKGKEIYDRHNASTK